MTTKTIFDREIDFLDEQEWDALYKDLNNGTELFPLVYEIKERGSTGALDYFVEHE